MPKCFRFALSAAFLLGLSFTAGPPANADPQTFHIIDINEVYSNADGTKQFIELFAGSDFQTNLAPTWIIALNADGTDTNIVFDFTATFPALNNNETILLATAAMVADLGFTPDFIIPDNSIFFPNGRVIFEDPPPSPTMVDAVAFGAYTGSNTNFGTPTSALPTNGCASLVRNVHDYVLPKDNAAQWGVSAAATPRRNDGETITLVCAPVAPVLAPIGNKNVNEGQLLSFGASATDGNNDPLTLTAAPLPSGANFNDNGNGTGTFTWTPSFLQSGIYNVLFVVSDGGLADSEQVTITVAEITDPPVANNGSQDVLEDIPNDFALSATDPDLDDLTFVITSGPFHGDLSNLDLDLGEGTYTSDLNYNGRDSIFFHVTDGNATSNTAVHVFVVLPVNDPPVAGDLNPSTNINTLVSIGPMPVTDVDDAAWTISHTSGPFHGSVSNFDPNDGSFDYTPDLDYLGADTITYTADDGHSPKSAVPSNTGTIIITITEGCDCPCHGDPACDGALDVLDVVAAVNVAFRGAADNIDAGCPHAGRTDSNCDCFVDILDVVGFVNRAFRGDPAPFCNPCVSPCP